MRKLSVILGSVILALGVCGPTFGGSITLDTDTLSNLLGGTPVAVTDLMVSDVSNTVVQSDVYSRAYWGPNGLYAYLYQLDNTGDATAGAHSLERITLAPFWGASAGYSIGYLSSLDGTDGFIAGGELPEPTGYVTDDTELPEVSFNYRKWRGYQIDPGEHTQVMYVVTEHVPFGRDGQVKEINANVIDGLVATGFVIGPGSQIPEPNTIILLFTAIGLAFAGRFRR